MTGKIVRLIEKGFGFIKDPAGTEYFFHRSGLVDGEAAFDQLREGQLVTFEKEESLKGPRAHRVNA